METNKVTMKEVEDEEELLEELEVVADSLFVAFWH